MATVSRGGTSERFGFIKRHAIDLGVTYLCQWLKVSRSGYYAWLKRLPSQRSLDDKELSHKIMEIHRDNRGAYGSPRIHLALKQQGENVGKKRVERLMQQQRLQGRVVQVTRRQPGLKRFIERGENLRLNEASPKKINQV